MKWLSLAMLLFVAACAAIPQPITTQSIPTSSGKTADLPDLGPAPELTNETWLNTDQPLHLADLRGKVVLLDMWTFG
jgi:hypothetical protein